MPSPAPGPRAGALALASGRPCSPSRGLGTRRSAQIALGPAPTQHRAVRQGPLQPGPVRVRRGLGRPGPGPHDRPPDRASRREGGAAAGIHPRTRCATATPPPPWPQASRSPRPPAGSATAASRSPIRSTATPSPPPGTAPAPFSTTPATRPGISPAPEPRAESVLTPGHPAGHLPAETATRSTIFTIFEGTSEIQRMIIRRAVTGLDVR
jgi:hypothetical protein